jgi:hypothetical protein
MSGVFTHPRPGFGGALSCHCRHSCHRQEEDDGDEAKVGVASTSNTAIPDDDAILGCDEDERNSLSRLQHHRRVSHNGYIKRIASS